MKTTRNISLLVLMTLFAAGSAFAQASDADFQVGVGFINHVHTSDGELGDSNTWKFSGIGLRFIQTSRDPLFFYGRGDIAAALWGSLNSAEIDMGIYRIAAMIELLGGVGYNLVQTPDLNFALGVGPIASTDQYLPERVMDDSVNVITLGAGMDLNLSYAVTPGISLALSGNLSYQFFPIFESYGFFMRDTFNRSINWGLGVGVLFGT